MCINACERAHRKKKMQCTHRDTHAVGLGVSVAEGCRSMETTSWAGLRSRKADCSGTQTIVQHHTDFKYTHTHIAVDMQLNMHTRTHTAHSTQSQT